MASIQEFLRRSATDARAREREQARLRNLARPQILEQTDVAGDYDTERALLTTLGGRYRSITPADIRKFAQFARSLGKKFKGGVTPQQFINLSAEADRERSRQQITLAVPARNKGGWVQFVTNASKESDSTRHFVAVQFMGYYRALSTPQTARLAASAMTKAQVKVDCDCGRWNYWYRFMATTGGYNCGRPETGYPDERNPKLNGLACKHILRVMVAIRQGAMQSYLTKMVETGRKADTQPGTVRTSQAQASQIAAAQQARKAAIEPRAVRESSRASVQRTIRQSRDSVEKVRQRQSVDALLRSGVLTQKQYAAIIKRIEER